MDSRLRAGPTGRRKAPSGPARRAGKGVPPQAGGDSVTRGVRCRASTVAQVSTVAPAWIGGLATTRWIAALAGRIAARRIGSEAGAETGTCERSSRPPGLEPRSYRRAATREETTDFQEGRAEITIWTARIPGADRQISIEAALRAGPPHRCDLRPAPAMDPEVSQGCGPEVARAAVAAMAAGPDVRDRTLVYAKFLPSRPVPGESGHRLFFGATIS